MSITLNRYPALERILVDIILFDDDLPPDNLLALLLCIWGLSSSEFDGYLSAFKQMITPIREFIHSNCNQPELLVQFTLGCNLPLTLKLNFLIAIGIEMDSAIDLVKDGFASFKDAKDRILMYRMYYRLQFDKQQFFQTIVCPLNPPLIL